MFVRPRSIFTRSKRKSKALNKTSTCAMSLNLAILFILLYLFPLIVGEPMKIRPKLCNNAFGEQGTCMFVWECIKTEGKHLGTCMDGFLFGSCCGHNDSYNNLDQSVEPSESSIVFEFSTNSVKEKHKNKWKPTSSTPSSESFNITLPPSTTITPTTFSTNAQSHTATKVVPVTSKPLTTPRPFHQRPSSTFRPAVISPLITNKPSSIHLPLLSNIPNRNLTNRPPPINLVVNEWDNIPLNNSEEFVTNQPTINTARPELSNGLITLSNWKTSTILPSQTLSSEGTVNNRPINGGQSRCGITQLRPRTKVVGGKNSAFGAWPWQVSVRRTHFFGFSSTHRCGGAILNNQWIATAGHCVDDLLLTQIRIRVGEYDFSSSLEPLPHIERGAKKKIVHPKYNFFTYENDLALVQLDEPLDFFPHISAICLPPDNINLIGKNATVTGWGRLSEGGILPTVLQEVRVPIVSNDKCKNMFLSAGRHEYIPDIFMCAGYDDGGRDSCQGDSGGPLQVQGDDGRWFLAGIISWGIGCGEPSLPGVCTRITKFKQWILSYISN